MHRIVYLSRASLGLTEGAIDQLVQSAREKNARLGITGALLFERGHFFQVLEGPRRELRALFRKIRADERHSEVRLLIEDDSDCRRFASWSLAWNRKNDESLSEHFNELRASVISPGPLGNDLDLIQKFLVIFHGFLPRGKETAIPSATSATGNGSSGVTGDGAPLSPSSQGRSPSVAELIDQRS